MSRYRRHGVVWRLLRWLGLLALVYGGARMPSLPPGSDPPAFEPMRAQLERLERSEMVRALRHTRGNVREAAKLLSVVERSFWNRMKHLGIKPDLYR